MVNTQKIKGRIIEYGFTIQTLAPEIPCTPYTLGQKLNNEQPIWLHEIEKLIDLLCIKDSEFNEFFLYGKLQKSNNNGDLAQKERG